MQKIKIGILDEEKEYAIKLSTYLQRYGKGKWDLTAFTNESAVTDYLEKRSLDILAGTDRRSLAQLGSGQPIVRLWLANKKTELNEKREDIYSIYRFQSAEEIGHCLDGIVKQECTCTGMETPIVAVYSPVGRCGKTTLALEVVKSGTYGKWLYFGMEDYSSFKLEPDKKGCAADEILYYWKEHRGEKMLELLENAGSVVATGSSFYDVKQISLEDMKWFKEELQKSDYRGVVFDIGTGILQDFQILKEFDHLLVPYIEEERAIIKTANFETLLALCGMEENMNRVHFLNMNQKSEVTALIHRIFEGDML